MLTKLKHFLTLSLYTFRRNQTSKKALQQTIAELQVEISERKQAEAELRHHQTHLEEQAVARTWQLEATNHRLLTAMAERQRAEQEREVILSSERQQRLLAETLSEVTLALNSQTNLTAVLDEVLRQTKRLVPYQTAHIMLLEGDYLQIAGWQGYKPDSAELIAHLVQPLADFPLDAAVVRSQKAVVIPNTHQETGWVVQKETAWVKSHLVAPICLQEKVLGLLRLDGDTPNQFSAADAQKLAALTNAAAIALENARLLELEHRRTKELAIARDQALEASHLKSELLARVSHELRTPLGAILGFTEMLTEGVYGPLSAEQQKAAKHIIISTHELTKMVNNLLDQAHLMAGAIQLANEPFNPRLLLEQLETAMQPLAQQKGLQFITQMDSHLPTVIIGDSKRLYQILANLTGNALKFTEQGWVRVNLYRSNHHQWILQVADSGPGIPVKAQSLIFEAFQQVDGSITRRHGGSGLGLSIVKQLTTLMDGHLTMDSQLGQGTTFTVTLPLISI